MVSSASSDRLARFLGTTPRFLLTRNNDITALPRTPFQEALEQLLLIGGAQGLGVSGKRQGMP